MQPEIKQNKEFAQWLGEWITRGQQTRDGIEQLPYMPGKSEEQSALPCADSNQWPQSVPPGNG
jgi:hypothetical protein